MQKTIFDYFKLEVLNWNIKNSKWPYFNSLNTHRQLKSCGIWLHHRYSCWHPCGARVVTQIFLIYYILALFSYQTSLFLPYTYAMYSYQLNYLWHFPLGWFYYSPLLTFARNIFISLYCYGHRILSRCVINLHHFDMKRNHFRDLGVFFSLNQCFLCQFLNWHSGGDEENFLEIVWRFWLY